MLSLKGKRILIISPHPDDEAIGCGGLLSKAKRDGATVFVLYMCVGSTRQLVTGSTNPDTRMKETKNVAKFCGFDYRFVYVGEQFLRLDMVPQKELIDHIEDKISDFKPDIVCIPSGNSYDQDHRVVFTACITAMRPVPATVRKMPSLVLEYEEPYVWSIGSPEKPNFYIELTEKDAKNKEKAMSLHATQHRKDPFPRSGENLIRWLEIRGKEIGSFYAEAYKCHRMAVR